MASIEVDQDYCVRLLERLVNIPSINPCEEEVMLFLERELSEKGLHPTRIDLAPGRSNLLCSVGSGYPRICLNAHADTVAPSGSSLPKAKIDGDIMWGLGTCDDKASVAAMVTALAHLASHEAESLTGTVDLIISVDEEVGGRGVESVIESGYTCDFAIIGECTCLDIVHAHCGVLFLTLTTTGLAAHGSSPAVGENAIWRMTGLVRDIEAAVTQFAPHCTVGAPSLNLGEIHAGDRPNRVPDKCTARVDIRIVPPVTVAQIIDKVNGAMAGKDWASYEIERRWEPVETLAGSVLIKAVSEAAAEMGVVSNLIGWRGGTEAEPFQTRLGVDAIVLGPGDIRQAHSGEEFVSISETQLAAQIYVESVLRLGALAGS